MPRLPSSRADAPKPSRPRFFGRGDRGEKPSTNGAAHHDAGEAFDEALLHAKLDAMKELAYGASHEINNPLANIALRAQTLLKREEDADKRKMLEAVHRQAMRAHEMISDLMLFARPPAPEKQEASLLEIANEVFEEYETLAHQQQITLSLSPGEDPRVWADPTQLAVALKALLDNSFDALGEGGEVLVRVGLVDAQSSYLEVIDNGPGIPAEIREHIFDPFFSGREAGRGLGFGLSKCWRIVTMHGGSVRLIDRAPQGVIARIELPTKPGAPRQS